MAKKTVGEMDGLSRVARAYWNGEMPLWGQFWVFGMFFGCLLGLVMTMLSPMVMREVQISWELGQWQVTALYGYVAATLFGFWGTYYLWHVVSVWRCAAHERVLVKWAARVFVLLVTVTYWPLYFYVVFGEY